MNIGINNIKFFDFEIYIDKEKVIPHIEQGNYYKQGDEVKNISYKFQIIKDYEVKIIFNKTISNMKYLFTDCYDLISINFSETFDSSYLLSMSHMFSGCNSLKYVNVSSLNTSLVGDMFDLFKGCSKLTSLSLSNFNTKNIYIIQGIFSNCDNLNFIDISSFDPTYWYFYNYMFDGLPENGTILINDNLFIRKIYPKDWNIIKK